MQGSSTVRLTGHQSILQQYSFSGCYGSLYVTSNHIEKTTLTHGPATPSKTGRANPVPIGGLIRAIDTARGSLTVLHRAAGDLLLSGICYGYTLQAATLAVGAVSAKYRHLYLEQLLLHRPSQHVMEHWMEHNGKSLGNTAVAPADYALPRQVIN